MKWGMTCSALGGGEATPPFGLCVFLQQLLECNKCRNSYHPECLGPNYPTKPTKKKKVWVSSRHAAQETRPGTGGSHGFRRNVCPEDVCVAFCLSR